MACDGGFDHEKLDVYRLSIEFQRWVGLLIEGGLGTGDRLSAAKHLDDASTSTSNYIAQGNGKRSVVDGCRFLDISRGSALDIEHEHEHEHEHVDQSVAWRPLGAPKRT